jgi:hypothetical protein
VKRVRVEVRDGLAELFRGRLQDLRRFPGRERWDWEIVGFLAAFVCDPKDIQGGFVTLGYAHPFRPRAKPCYGPLKRPEGVKRGLKMSKMLNGLNLWMDRSRLEKLNPTTNIGLSSSFHDSNWRPITKTAIIYFRKSPKIKFGLQT